MSLELDDTKEKQRRLKAAHGETQELCSIRSFPHALRDAPSRGAGASIHGDCALMAASRAATVLTSPASRRSIDRVPHAAPGLERSRAAPGPPPGPPGPRKPL